MFRLLIALPTHCHGCGGIHPTRQHAGREEAHDYLLSGVHPAHYGHMDPSTLGKKPIELKIKGDAYFGVQGKIDQGDGMIYTRVVHLFINEEGMLVNNSPDGPPIMFYMTVPPDATKLAHYHRRAGFSPLVPWISVLGLGQIGLYTFPKAGSPESHRRRQLHRHGSDRIDLDG